MHLIKCMSCNVEYPTIFFQITTTFSTESGDTWIGRGSSTYFLLRVNSGAATLYVSSPNNFASEKKRVFLMFLLVGWRLESKLCEITEHMK